MKKILFSIFALILGVAYANAQEGDYATLLIKKATVNNEDHSDLYQSEEAYIVFYKDDDGSLYMANVCPKSHSQSYGTVMDWKLETFQSTPVGEPTNVVGSMDEYSFKWHYKNTYDDEEGVAECLLVKSWNIYDTPNTTYELTITGSDDLSLVVSGEFEGDLAAFFTKEENNATSRELIGNWNTVEFNYGLPNDEEIYKIDPADAGLKITFNADGTGAHSTYGELGDSSYAFTYYLDDNVVVLEYEDGDKNALVYADGQLALMIFTEEINMIITLGKTE